MRRLLLTPLLAVLLLTAACNGDEPVEQHSSTSSAATGASSSAPAVATSAAPASSAPADPDALVLEIKVQGNTVTGDTGTVQVQLGKKVHLTVSSDVADEVHVHGADVHADVEAGGTVVLDFVEQAPGRFEVELESRKQVLTRLEVR